MRGGIFRIAANHSRPGYKNAYRELLVVLLVCMHRPSRALEGEDLEGRSRLGLFDTCPDVAMTRRTAKS